MDNNEPLQSSLQHRNVRVLKCEIATGDARQEYNGDVSFETNLGYDINLVTPIDQASTADKFYYCSITLQIIGNAALDSKSQYKVNYLSCCELRCPKEGLTEQEFLTNAEASGLITLISNARAQIQGATAILGYMNPYVFPLLNISAVIKDHHESVLMSSDKS